MLENCVEAGRSFIYSIKSIGPRMLTYGKQDFTSNKLEIKLFCDIRTLIAIK